MLKKIKEKIGMMVKKVRGLIISKPLLSMAIVLAAGVGLAKIADVLYVIWFVS